MQTVRDMIDAERGAGCSGYRISESQHFALVLPRRVFRAHRPVRRHYKRVNPGKRKKRPFSYYIIVRFSITFTLNLIIIKIKSK